MLEDSKPPGCAEERHPLEVLKLLVKALIRSPVHPLDNCCNEAIS